MAGEVHSPRYVKVAEPEVQRTVACTNKSQVLIEMILKLWCIDVILVLIAC